MSVIGGFFIGLSLLFGSLYVSTLNLLHISSNNQNWVPISKAIPLGGYYMDYTIVNNRVETNQPQGADPSAFQISTIDWQYSKDINNVYYYLTEPTLMLGADPKSFFLISQQYKDGSSIAIYSKDNLHVYFQGLLIVGADPASFIPLGTGFGGVTNPYSKDSRYVFYDGIILSSDGLGKNPLTGIDSSTFEPLIDTNGEISLYAKDSKQVYFNAWDHGDGAPNPFQVIQNADPLTFQVVSGQSIYDAQDKNHKYLQGQIVQPVSRTFKWIPFTLVNDSFYKFVEKSDGLHLQATLPSHTLDRLFPEASSSNLLINVDSD
ncbi:MAG TPA: DKNYY domain-containing protein, partial [Candidatus Paceibacterota bacterium]|nr:DKNYY domain-containing protein [Candidatus Paceibacterota bacterium]